MAFANGLRSPPNELSLPASYAPPPRTIGTQFSTVAPTSSAERAQLHRRFTTNALPTISTLPSIGPLSPIGQQRRQAAEPPSDLAAATQQKMQLLQKRREEYETLQEQRLMYSSALESFDAAKKDEMQRLASDIRRLSMGGHQSEPTTPPEYRENGFAVGNRMSRHSLASLASTPGIGSIASPRALRSGSHSASTALPTTMAHGLPSYSVPQSRRGSDEEEDSFSNLEFAATSRRTVGFNRNSMPAMSSSRLDYTKGVDSILGLDTINSLLADDDVNAGPAQSLKALTEGGKHLHMETNGEGFPLLRRRDTDADLEDWKALGSYTVHRHRAGQQSLPWNTLPQSQHNDADDGVFASPGRGAATNNRRSMEVYSNVLGTQSKRSSMHSTSNNYNGHVPKLQQSYSTNDIPTIKSATLHDTVSRPGAHMTHAEQHLHNHIANLGRLPAAASNRQSRDFSILDTRADEPGTLPYASSLQANAPTFQTPQAASNTGAVLSGGLPPTYATASNAFYNNYSLPPPNNGMNGATYVGSGNNWGANGFLQNNHNYGSYHRPTAQPPDSQRAVMKSRKGEDENARFALYNLEALEGQLYELCKDQHGCRYLQRKIEEGNERYIAMIFSETQGHIVELMTDPFGNYLCQKLLEYCNDEQRSTLISNAGPHMIQIALNQHGTRALQKMIEFISTPRQARRENGPPVNHEVNRYQIEAIKHALSVDIVGLIQDLNGNHVIQKCLNHLKPDDAEFIFEEVARNCLSVGTHRHGCCVLQRCIDHAVEDQKLMLIQSVVANAFALVQDPFGNYVVQYILDLNVAEYTRPVCLSFRGRMVELSRQKFSSNVMEKMIRCSPIDIRHELCMEFMTSSSDVERHIRDMYANYVIQTILDHGSPETVEHMWALIGPIIDRVRATPAGRRINTKFQARQNATEQQQPLPIVNGVYYPPQNLAWTAQGHQQYLGANPQQPFF